MLITLMNTVFLIVFSSASQQVNCTRSSETELDRITAERGNIVVDVNQTQPDKAYSAG